MSICGLERRKQSLFFAAFAGASGRASRQVWHHLFCSFGFRERGRVTPFKVHVPKVVDVLVVQQGLPRTGKPTVKAGGAAADAQTLVFAAESGGGRESTVRRDVRQSRCSGGSGQTAHCTHETGKSVTWRQERLLGKAFKHTGLGKLLP